MKVKEGAGRALHLSDHLSPTATTLLPKWHGIDFAVAPLAGVFLRGDGGWRPRGLPIARFERDGCGLSIAFSSTGAARQSATNPSGTWDMDGGVGRRIGLWTVYVNSQWERSTGVPWQVSLSR